METKASALPLLIPAFHQIRSVWAVKSGYLFWLCTSQRIIGHEYGWLHGPWIPRPPQHQTPPTCWNSGRPSLIFHLIFWEAQSVTTGYARMIKIAQEGLRHYGVAGSTWSCSHVAWSWLKCDEPVWPPQWHSLMPISRAEWPKVSMLPGFRFLYFLPWLYRKKHWDYSLILLYLLHFNELSQGFLRLNEIYCMLFCIREDFLLCPTLTSCTVSEYLGPCVTTKWGAPRPHRYYYYTVYRTAYLKTNAGLIPLGIP